MCASRTKIRSLQILHTLNTKEISIEKLPSSYRVFANIILRYLKKKKNLTYLARHRLPQGYPPQP